MKFFLKIIWIIIISILIGSCSYFLIGSTANFQRKLYLEAVLMLAFWIPLVIFIFLSIYLLKHNWYPTSTIGYVTMLIVFFVTIPMSKLMIDSVKIEGWLVEYIREDMIRTTSDEKYEYQLIFSNLWQKNSSAKLFIRNLHSGDELFIPIDISTENIGNLLYSFPLVEWAKLIPTENKNVYLLITLESLKIPEEKFEINIKEKFSIKIN